VEGEGKLVAPYPLEVYACYTGKVRIKSGE